MLLVEDLKYNVGKIKVFKINLTTFLSLKNEIFLNCRIWFVKVLISSLMNYFPLSPNFQLITSAIRAFIKFSAAKDRVEIHRGIYNREKVRDFRCASCALHVVVRGAQRRSRRLKNERRSHELRPQPQLRLDVIPVYIVGLGYDCRLLQLLLPFLRPLSFVRAFSLVLFLSPSRRSLPLWFAPATSARSLDKCHFRKFERQFAEQIYFERNE